MNRNELEKKLRMISELKIRKSRNSFWEYCKTRAPEFYKENRFHLKTICNTLQNLYDGKLLNDDGHPYKNLIMNLPP